jgi:hypothetical protein
MASEAKCDERRRLRKQFTWLSNAHFVDVIHLASQFEGPMCELLIPGTVSFWAALYKHRGPPACEAGATLAEAWLAFTSQPRCQQFTLRLAAQTFGQKPNALSNVSSDTEHRMLRAVPFAFDTVKGRARYHRSRWSPLPATSLRK